jgi:hypothetical protein
MVKMRMNKRGNSHFDFEKNKRIFLKSKRSQLTVFVILALVLVLGMAIFFIVKNPQINPNISPGENPQGYMDDCVKNALIEVEGKLIENNLFLNLQNSYINFNNSKVPYYCFAPTELTLCTTKHPAISNEITKQIDTQVKPKIEKCFNDVKDQFKDYDYNEGGLNITIEIMPKTVQAKITKDISYTKNEQRINLQKFDNSINSPLFDFMFIGNEIVNQELSCECGVKSCNADVVKLSLNNRNFEIAKPSFEKYDEIYSIKEILSGKQINLAVRNCYKNVP